MSTWNRNNRLASLIAERDLLTRGFRRSLRSLVSEFVVPEDLAPEDRASIDEIRKYEFEEWFGDLDAVPAAHRIVRNGYGVWDTTIEVYEVENTVEISEYKLATYGRIADGDGPLCELHILDRHDHELVVPNELLECFVFIDLCEKAVDGQEYKRALLKEMRARAVAQHHTPIVVDEAGADDRKREIAKLRREIARQDYAHIAGALHHVIYGLGSGRSYKQIASTANTTPAVVKLTARLLKAQNVNPTDLVKGTHAKWKAAYDAVRELGIPI